MNANKSCRKSDVPAKVLKKFAGFLCGPLTEIINNCIQSGTWPDYLKHEVVTPIPKIPNPKVLEDLRNISGLLNINKVMEKVTSKWILSDMQAKMDPAQFGNRKGVSIQHYLVKMFDEILKQLDRNSHGEAVAAILTMIDWKEAFPRQDPTLAIQSFINNGVRPSLIPILMSFFENRRMTVKWRGAMSAVKRLKGGGLQGSTKGVLSYMSQSNSNSDCVPIQERFKYFDDLTVLEFVNLLNIGLSSQNVKLRVPSNLPSHNQFIPYNHLKTQGYLNKISDWTEDNLMMLNVKKTKALLVNNSKKYQFTTGLMVKDQVLEIVDEAKLLGTYITSDLKWDKNTDFLVKEAIKRMRLLHAASKFVKDKKILTQLYYTHIRAGAVCCSLAQQPHIKEYN